jgi:hypothetical protein
MPAGNIEVLLYPGRDTESIDGEAREHTDQFFI